MGKQHKARGEDASALRMYQMALPYFPDNEKLKAKIRGLEDRIRIKKESEAVVYASKTSSKLMAPLKSERKDVSVVHDEEDMDDGEFAPGEGFDQDESYASDGSFSYKPKAGRKTKKATKKLSVFRDTTDENTSYSSGHQTPRTKQLLRIINSRDANQIRALKGVGSKRADAIVSCLLALEDEEVHDLERLATLKGVGGRTVENMRLGLTVGYDF